MKHVLVLSALLSLIFTGCSFNKSKSVYPESHRELHRFVYERNIPEIVKALSSTNSDLQLIAASAAASIADTSLIAPLRKLLTSEDAALRSTACFALGQIGNSTDLKELESVLQNEKEIEVLASCMVACSKLYNEKNNEEYLPNTEEIISPFISFLLNARSDADVFYRAYAESVFNLNRKKIHYPKFIERMRYMLLKCEPETRVVFAQAIAGYEHYDLLQHKDYIEQWLEIERSDDVKVFVIQAAGKVASPDILNRIKAIATTPTLNVKTRWSAMQALEKKNALDKKTLSALAVSNHPKISRKALEIAAENKIVLDISASDSIENEIPYIKGAWYAYQISIGKQNADNQCLADFHATSNEIQKTFFIEALAYSNKHSDDLLQLCLLDPSPIVRYAASNAIYSQVKNKRWKSSISAAQAIQRAMETHDPGVIDVVVSLISEKVLSAEETTVLLKAALDEQTKLTMPRDIEVYNHIIDLKNQILNTQDQHLIASARFPISWDDFLPRSKVVRLETSKGNISIQLRSDLAPISTIMLLSLIEQGFYNGKYFHRVVPNFVAQGGCPTGTGMGSLDQPIISEFSSYPYNKGTVGLASSGSDTESCQFFITHQSTPHLNGRYTIIGEMVDGWEVLDNLIIGDQIIRCAIE